MPATPPARSRSTRRVSAFGASCSRPTAPTRQYKQGLSFVIEKVGDIKRDIGDTAGALAAYQEMLGLDREVAAANIGDTKRQRVVSVDLNKIADLKLAANDSDGALAAVEESLNISRHIALTAPDNIEWQRDISVSLERLGNIKSSTGDKQGALKAYEEMLSIDRRVADAEAANLQRVREVMFSLNKVGDMRFDLNDMSGALANYDEGARIARKLVEKDADNPGRARDLAISLDKVGDAKLKAGRRQGRAGRFRGRPRPQEADRRRQQGQLPVSARRDRSPLTAVGDAKARVERRSRRARRRLEERLALSPRPRRAAQGRTSRRRPISWSASTSSPRSRSAERKDAVIDEGLQILARLDADGKLTDDQKGWSESFLTLRNGSQ